MKKQKKSKRSRKQKVNLKQTKRQFIGGNKEDVIADIPTDTKFFEDLRNISKDDVKELIMNVPEAYFEKESPDYQDKYSMINSDKIDDLLGKNPIYKLAREVFTDKLSYKDAVIKTLSNSFLDKAKLTHFEDIYNIMENNYKNFKITNILGGLTAEASIVVGIDNYLKAKIFHLYGKIMAGQYIDKLSLHFLKAAAINCIETDIVIYSSCIKHIQRIYIEIGDFEIAKEMHEIANNNIFSVILEEGKKALAEDDITKAIVLHRIIRGLHDDGTYEAANCDHRIAVDLMKIGRENDALTLLKSAKRFYDKKKHKVKMGNIVLANIKYSIAKIYRKLGNYSKAITLFKSIKYVYLKNNMIKDAKDCDIFIATMPC